MPRKAKTHEYILPFPPSVNHYWFHKGNHIFLGARGREYREHVIEICGKGQPLRRRLAVQVTLIMPDRRERDLDNYNKGVLDALAHAGVYLSDNQIDDLRILRGHVAPPGCVKVHLREIGVGLE